MTLIYILYPFLFSIIPILFLYHQNIVEISNKSLTSILIGISILYAVLYLILINFFEIHFTSIIVFNFFIYFYSIKKIIWKSIIEPIKKKGRVSFFHWLYYSLILVFTYFSLFYKFNYNIISIFSKIMLLVFTFINVVLIFNIIAAIKKLQKYNNNLNSETNFLNDSINNNTYPNIFLIIPDSYPGNESLKEYINFDNIDFLNYLKEKKFNVFDKSLSNYWFTHFSVPSTLNMDYLHNCCNISEDGFIKLTPDVKNVFENNKIFAYLKNKGYKIISIVSEWENNQELIKTNSEQLYFGNNTNYSFLVTLFDNSLLSYLFKILKYKNRIEEINNIVKFFQSKKTNKQPEFIFVHMLMPHPPFIINKNLKLDYKKTILSQNFQESFKSLLKKEKPEDIINQIKYTNKILESIIESILEKDKDSIIVIQSDHGNHMSEFFGKKDNFEYEYDITFFNILKSIYYKGEKIEFNSLTSVNTFRNIFNLCFNDNFEILEDKLQINDPSSCTDTRVGIGMNMKFNEIDVKDANFFN
ncbi:sulfatase-like hydrolase/transferase [Brachyspira alvinipulli]|uniref:sulfatase-like hydrolase/transferase n=1 Tax=Brachyspira alvinipulli TaxID=84379 RepID=UPI0004839828|nr:sulfatase-like hydrolase/transferase [Brachyspira alvinipulli]